MPRGHRDWGRVDSGIPGVNELDTYLTFRQFTAAADVTTRFLSMFNPANSGRRAQIRRLLLNVAAEETPEGVSVGNFRLFRTTDAGDGLLITPRPTHATFPASSLTVHDGTLTAPTESFELAFLISLAERRQVPAEAYLSNPTLFFDLYHHDPGSAETPLTIDPGEGLVFRVGTAGNAWLVAFLVHHTEEFV